MNDDKIRKGDRRCWCIYCNGQWRPRQTHHTHLSNPQNLEAKQDHEKARSRRESEPDDTSNRASKEPEGREMEELSGSGGTGRDSQGNPGGGEDSLHGSDLPPSSPPSIAHGDPAEFPSQSSSSLEGADDQQSHSTDRDSSASSLVSLDDVQPGQLDDQEFSGDESASVLEFREGSVNYEGQELHTRTDESWSAARDVPLDLTGVNPSQYVTSAL